MGSPWRAEEAENFRHFIAWALKNGAGKIHTFPWREASRVRWFSCRDVIDEIRKLLSRDLRS